MLQMARRPFMVPPLRYQADVVRAWLVPDLGPIRPAEPASGGSGLIIINALGLSEGRSFPPRGVIHANFLSIICRCVFGLGVPARRLGRLRRQPRLHRCQPGGWL